MEFRSCPACKASILDDDVDDCPFCGASLSGKGGSAKPAPARSGAKPASTTAAATGAKGTGTTGPKGGGTSAKGAASPEPAEDQDSDPFDVDTSAVRSAHPVSTKRTKATPFPVTCPMCETSGFIAVRAAGKDVKCCNPNCMVPVFKAPPLPKKEEPVVETAPQGMTQATKIALGTLAGLVVIASWIVFRMWSQGSPATPSGNGPNLTVPTRQGGTNVETEPEQTEQPTVPRGPKYTLDFIFSESLPEIARQSARRDNNRSQPFCRQMVAEVHAELGDISKAREALGQLRDVARGARYLEISPLAELAWHHFRQGQTTEANAILTEAVAFASDLPKVGRQPLDDLTLLCAALCRADRYDGALALVKNHRTQESRAQMSAWWRGALDFETFNLLEQTRRPYLMTMPDPLSVAITRTLAAKQEWDHAWTWATRVEGVDVQHNCQAAWAGALVSAAHQSGNVALRERLAEAIGQATPVGRARMWAAAADAHLQAGKMDEADQALAQARQELSEVTIPGTQMLPGMRAIHDSRGRPFAGLADPAPLRSLALAWADIGQLEAARSRNEEAWSAFHSGLNALRGTTPGPTATRGLITEVEQQANQIRSRLADAGVRDAMNTGFNQYRAQCDQLHAQAVQRFAWQQALMQRAVESGLLDNVWNHIQERQSTSLPVHEQEPWYTSTTIGRLVVVSSHAQRRDIVNQIGTTITPRPQPSVLDNLHFFVLSMKPTEDVNVIRERFVSVYGNNTLDTQLLDRVFLEVVTSLFQSGRITDAYELARRGPSASVREDALRLLASLAIVSSKQDPVWEAFADGRSLSVTERVAAYRGFLDGVIAVRRRSAP